MSRQKVEVSEEQRHDVARSWTTHSLAEIQERTGLSRTVINRIAKEMGLGRKPAPKIPPELRSKNKSEAISPTCAKPSDFLDRLDALYQLLQDRRDALLSQLERLEGREGRQFEQARVATKRELKEVEELIVECHKRKKEAKPLRRKTARDISSPDALFEELSKSETRKREGILMGKNRIAMEKVRSAWSEPRTWEDGTIDCVYLCPEDFAEDKSNE